MEKENKRVKHEVVILYSGGRDSTLLLEMAEDLKMNPACLIIHYEQKHSKEVDFAKEYCSERHIPYHIMYIRNLGVSSKLTEGDTKYEGVSEWHVPSRNMIFISLAAAVAESKGISLIWYGANYDDRESLFPDCYQEWVHQMNKLLAINGSTKIRLEAPLLGMNKKTIVSLCKQYNINEDKIFSGYGKIE